MVKKELPPEQGQLFTDEVAVPNSEAGISVDVKKRAENLLRAEAALGQVSMLKGLSKAVHKPRERAKLESRYNRPAEEGKPAEDVLSSVVIPGAEGNKSKLMQEATQAFDDAFGDFEAAKAAAWQEFSPEERALLEIETPDQEEFRAAFRAKHLDSRTYHSPKRSANQIRHGERPRRTTVGKKNREVLRKQMEKTLKRFPDSNSNQQAA